MSDPQHSNAALPPLRPSTTPREVAAPGSSPHDADQHALIATAEPTALPEPRDARQSPSDRRDELRAHIVRDKAELAQALDDLKQSTTDLDPRGRIQEDPYGWLVGGFLIGFCTGILTR